MPTGLANKSLLSPSIAAASRTSLDICKGSRHNLYPLIFGLHGAGRDLPAGLAYKFNGILRRLNKEQEAWAEDAWLRYSSDRKELYKQPHPEVDCHLKVQQLVPALFLQGCPVHGFICV